MTSLSLSLTPHLEVNWHLIVSENVIQGGELGIIDNAARSGLLDSLQSYMNKQNGVTSFEPPGWKKWNEEDFVVRKYLNYSGLKNALGTYNCELRQKISPDLYVVSRTED
jgi:hypothetical protein